MEGGHPDVTFKDTQLVRTEVLLEYLQERNEVLDQVGVFAFVSNIAKLQNCLLELQMKGKNSCSSIVIFFLV